ncbi:hypothetical protein HUG15_21655 [Salicibibacter cibarius]|uniref:Uncharacterized protein n=1 Tax=Salicibibacter cibarius TaxID=2743000 RepID=A0A7T6Z6N7_9BACI|nr:hypothetical protein [Salicibibacter cibarius]QQK77926.1 hypothetical protein HUG15_21655 [Salicibibacter cibarius]
MNVLKVIGIGIISLVCVDLFFRFFFEPFHYSWHISIFVMIAFFALSQYLQDRNKSKINSEK